MNPVQYVTFKKFSENLCLLIHQKIMRKSSKILDDVSVSVALNNCQDSDICCDVFSTLYRRLVSTNKLLIHKVTPFLNTSNSVYKFPNVWVIHPKFSLQSSMCCFHIVVGTILSIYCSLVDRSHMRRK
jgi:hypothetical protein